MSKKITTTDDKQLAVIDGDFWHDVFLDLNLSLGQKLFVQEYLANGGNATKASYKAYNPTNENSSASMGSRTLRIVKVQRAIDRALEVAQITPEWIKKNIKAIATNSKTKDATKLNALTTLGKAEGIFVERKLVGHVGKIEVNWGD